MGDLFEPSAYNDELMSKRRVTAKPRSINFARVERRKLGSPSCDAWHHRSLALKVV